MVHTPDTQVCPEEQITPQAPQFPVSLVRVRHVPLQSVCPEGQGVMHAPPEQICPAAQILPQTPQLFPSVWVDVHTLLHAVCPKGQLRHRPLEQVSLEKQGKKQPPQLSRSTARSTQIAPPLKRAQSVLPGGQMGETGPTHLPAEQL